MPEDGVARSVAGLRARSGAGCMCGYRRRTCALLSMRFWLSVCWGFRLRPSGSGLVISLACALLAGCGEAPTGESAVPALADGGVESGAAHTADYVGSRVCAGCHESAWQAWTGSHHQQAMMAPTATSVAGDFDDASLDHGSVSTFRRDNGRFVVRTDGPDGKPADYDVKYTFGVTPLQQYLLALPGGRLQASALAWDARPVDGGGQRWFHLHAGDAGAMSPDDVLHWTRDSQNWNFMCADCHSTALTKGYDPLTDAYDTRFEEMSVGCEACHGPGSDHVAAPAAHPVSRLTTQPEQLNACAPCHSRRSQLAEGFRPAAEYLDHYLPSLLDEGLYHTDGQILDEVYVYGSFVQSRMHARGVTCSNCHDAHSATLRLQGNAVCTQCHNPDGGPTTALAGGDERRDFPTLRRADYDTAAHYFHEPGGDGARCVSCHMPQKTYMVVDDRRDHSFRIPRPDLSVALGVPDPCTACHTDRTAEWAAGVIDARAGARPPHFAPVLAAARLGDPAVEADLAQLSLDAATPPIVRGTAMSLMAAYDRGSTALALEAGLRDPAPLVRIGALRGAARWPADKRWRLCRNLLDDDYLAVRTEATRALLDVFGGLTGSDGNRLRNAMDEYLDMLTLTADRAETQTSIAAVHLAARDAAGAERALDRALALNPQWVPALVNLADLYRATGRDSLGGALLERSVTLTPEQPDVLVARALWLVRQQQTETAVPLLADAWRQAPEQSRYAYIYAVALNSTGRWQEALDVLDGALERRPDDVQLLQTAFGIARDNGAVDRLPRYAPPGAVR